MGSRGKSLLLKGLRTHGHISGTLALTPPAGSRSLEQQHLTLYSVGREKRQDMSHAGPSAARHLALCLQGPLAHGLTSHPPVDGIRAVVVEKFGTGRLWEGCREGGIRGVPSLC